MTHSKIIRYLPLFSVSYLALPYIIFFLGYLRWYIAIFSCVILLSGLACHHKILSKSSLCAPWIFTDNVITFTRWGLLGGFFVIALWLFFSGVGGYGAQDYDWLKHNAILHDLIDSKWPLAYMFSPDQASGGNLPGHTLHTPLVYYIAYYLPAAVVGKLAGWFWANQFLMLWTFTGLCLALLWFLVLLQKATVFAVLLFFVFSGLDVVGLVLMKLLLQQPLAIASWGHLELWAANWAYPSHTTLLFWVPNQAISGWIATGMIVYVLLYAKRKHNILFYLGLTPLWTPFITLGLLPCVIADFLTIREKLWQRVKQYISVQNFCGLVFLLLLALFYASRFSSLPLPMPPIEKGLIFFTSRVSGFFWYETLSMLIVFVLVEVGIYALLVYTANRRYFTKQEATLFGISMGFLLLLPFFRYGQWNDLVMRASIPSLYVLCLFTLRTIDRFSWKKLLSLVLLGGLFLGALTPVIEFRRHFQKMSQRGVWYLLPEPGTLYTLRSPVNPSFLLQYVGDSESLFFAFLTKPLPDSSPPMISMRKQAAHE